jgi:hypothetical protein
VALRIMQQTGSHYTEYMLFYIWGFFASVEKTEVWIKPDKNNGYFKRRLIYIMNYSHNHVSGRNCRENQNTHFIFAIFSRKCCRL